LPDIDLVVTDLDGTLWDEQCRIHARTAAGLDVLARRGVPVVAATGRALASAVARLDDNGVRLPAAVLLDGSLGRDLRSGGTFHRRVFEPPAAAAVLRILRESGLSPCVVVDDPVRDLRVGDAPSSHPDHLAANRARLGRGSLAEVVRTLPVLSILICGLPRPPEAGPTARLRALGDVSISRDLTYGGHTLAIRPPCVTKWSGVLAYCALHGIDHTRVLTIGDGENDLELLSAASMAWAPANGCHAAIRLASKIIPPPDEGGWGAAIMRHLEC
jgi:hydroxymethylpyrimidine pyrophosphatase-like HAD family hydrolase